MWRCSHTGGHRFAPTAITVADGRAWAYADADLLEGVLGPHRRRRRPRTATTAAPLALEPWAQVVERAVFEQRRAGRWLDRELAEVDTEVADDRRVGRASASVARPRREPSTRRRTPSWSPATLPVLVCGEPPEAAKKSSLEYALRRFDDPASRSLHPGDRPGSPRGMAEYQTPEFHPAFEEYCEAIFELNEDDVEVIQARIADRLMVSRPAVSEMIKRLETDGLVAIDHNAISLTADGLRLAERVVRRHRLAERFLTDILGLSWADAHKEAGKWEHVISEPVEEAIVRVLGDPTTCPHGNPIPGADYVAPASVAAQRGRRRRRLHREPHPRGARVHPRPARVPRGGRRRARPQRHAHRRVARRHHHRRDRRPPRRHRRLRLQRILVTV